MQWTHLSVTQVPALGKAGINEEMPLNRLPESTAMLLLGAAAPPPRRPEPR